MREETGCSMVVIEHDMSLLTSLCDELVALELGSVITRGPVRKVLSHQAVIASYLGTDQKVIRRSGTRGSATRRTRKDTTRRASKRTPAPNR